MILSAFSLEGKVAVVTGCDTGLGQGMALGLAQAGCDIVGINIVEPTETIKQVTALGRRFLSLTADLRKIDGIPALLDRAVAEFGHMTFRAVRVLGEVDFIAAEDTRHTRKLLTHFDLHTPLISYHEHNEFERGPELISMLLEGKNIAVVSDAGCR